MPSADRATLRPIRAAWLARHYEVERDSDLKDLADADKVVDEAGSQDEVVLWFEADLFDQAILLHLLPRLADVCGTATRLTLVTLHEYPGMKRFIGLGQLTAPQLGELFTRRIDVSAEMVLAAREAWTAWVHPTPELLAGIVSHTTSPMTYLPAAARRMLEQLPDVRSGFEPHRAAGTRGGGGEGAVAARRIRRVTGSRGSAVAGRLDVLRDDVGPDPGGNPAARCRGRDGQRWPMDGRTRSWR